MSVSDFLNFLFSQTSFLVVLVFKSIKMGKKKNANSAGGGGAGSNKPGAPAPAKSGSTLTVPAKKSNKKRSNSHVRNSEVYEGASSNGGPSPIVSPVAAIDRSPVASEFG